MRSNSFIIAYIACVFVVFLHQQGTYCIRLAGRVTLWWIRVISQSRVTSFILFWDELCSQLLLHKVCEDQWIWCTDLLKILNSFLFWYFTNYFSPPLINFARQLDCKGKNLLNDCLDAKRLSSVFLLRDGKNIQGLSNETLG